MNMIDDTPATEDTPISALILRKNEDRRLRAGHNWIFSNEVDIKRTPLVGLLPGMAVRILDCHEKFIGYGYANPHALVCARVVSRQPDYPLTKSLMVHRLNVALSLRERLFEHPCYRLCYGDSDGLPGLVVDRYGDYLVVQIMAAGMECVKDDIVTALCQVCNPKGILLRNDNPMRELEGLDSYVTTIFGEIPDTVTINEGSAQFHVPLLHGQKTGWFFDHRLNRQRMTHYVKDKTVLDLFSYLGSWGIQAALAGAREVTCVDASASALELAEENARLNNVADKTSVWKQDVFEALRELRAQNRRFDVVILDPPAFIQRRKDVKNGIEAYRRVNQQAMQVLARDGILISASCSAHLDSDTLKDLLLKTSRHLDRHLVITEQGHQGPDHPIHPAMPEMEYLKTFFCRVLPSL